MKKIFKKVVNWLFTKKNRKMALKEDIVSLKNKVESIRKQLNNKTQNPNSIEDKRLIKAYGNLEVSLIPTLKFLEDTIVVQKEIEEIEEINRQKPKAVIKRHSDFKGKS